MTAHSHARNGHTPNSSGVHFLRDRRVISGLIDSADVGDGDLVVEFGSGPGILTAPLAGTGARVLAVERDTKFVQRLRRRFADRPAVRVVQADLRSVRLPRCYAVVANIPFSVSTALLDRLLAPGSGMTGADILVEWGLARRITDPCPRDLRTAWWAVHFDLHSHRRIPAGSFSPAPRVDAAHLRIRRRTGLNSATRQAVRGLLREVYSDRPGTARMVVRAVRPQERGSALLAAAGIDPRAAPRDVPVRAWVDLARAVA